MALTPENKSKLLHTLLCNFINEEQVLKHIKRYDLEDFAETVDSYSLEKHLVYSGILSEDTTLRQKQLLLLELGIRVKEETFIGRREAIMNAYLLHEYPLVLNHHNFIVDVINILSILQTMYNPNNGANVFKRYNDTLDTNTEGLCKALRIEVRERYSNRQWFQYEDDLIYLFGFHFSKWSEFDFYKKRAAKNLYWFKSRQERYDAICSRQTFFNALLCYKNWE